MSNEPVNHNDVISLKEIILGVKAYFFEVLRNWKLIALISLLCGILFFIRNKFDDDAYSAQLTFMLEDNEGGGGSMLSGLLGSFGFGGEGKGLNHDKLIELSRTDRIIREVLLKKIDIEGETDFLGNHLIRIYEYDKAWSKKETHPLNNFSFTQDSMALFGKKENMVIKQLRSKIVGSPSAGVEGLFSSRYSEDSGILYLTSKTVNEELSIHLVEELYEVLDSFFVSNAIEKQKRNFEIIKLKTDSLKADIQATEYALARFKDSERKLFRNVDRVEESRLANKLKISYLALGKAIENQEIADYSLKYQKPLLSVIDRPFLPLFNNRQPFIIAIFLGLVFGCILGAVFVVIRKKFREIMA